MKFRLCECILQSLKAVHFDSGACTTLQCPGIPRNCAVKHRRARTLEVLVGGSQERRLLRLRQEQKLSQIRARES